MGVVGCSGDSDGATAPGRTTTTDRDASTTTILTSTTTTDPVTTTTDPSSTTTDPSSTTTDPSSTTTDPATTTTDPATTTTAPSSTTTTDPVGTTTSPAVTSAPPTTPSPTTPSPTTASEPGAPRPQDYSGPVDDQPEGTTVAFVRSGSVTGFEVRDLEVECQPLAADGEAMSRQVSVAIAEAPIAADGTVAFTEGSATLKPSLSGSFAADGAFVGSLFLTGEDDGFVCGGEFTFTARPV